MRVVVLNVVADRALPAIRRRVGLEGVQIGAVPAVIAGAEALPDEQQAGPGGRRSFRRTREGQRRVGVEEQQPAGDDAISERGDRCVELGRGNVVDDVVERGDQVDGRTRAEGPGACRPGARCRRRDVRGRSPSFPAKDRYRRRRSRRPPAPAGCGLSHSRHRALGHRPRRGRRRGASRPASHSAIAHDLGVADERLVVRRHRVVWSHRRFFSRSFGPLDQGHAMSRPSKRSEPFHRGSKFSSHGELDWEHAAAHCLREARRIASPTTRRTSLRRR